MRRTQAALAAILATTAACMPRKLAVAPPLSIRVAATAERMARGRYIFENLADCDGCHSARDYDLLGAPVVAGRRGQGAAVPPETGLPRGIVASNITPDPETGVGRWTDGEKIRAIREGISRDGRVLFPVMPYRNYRSMSDRDVQALVAYMNTLPAIRNPLPRTRVNPFVAGFVRSWPRPAGSVPEPDRRDPVRYGEYLATLASCVDCHTPLKLGRPVQAKLFQGGRLFRSGINPLRSPNITPDATTGIGRWSEQDFLSRFYIYRRYVEKGVPKVGRESFSPMPWLGLSGLPPGDLRAIHAYLKSRPAIRNVVKR